MQGGIWRTRCTPWATPGHCQLQPQPCSTCAAATCIRSFGSGSGRPARQGGLQCSSGGAGGGGGGGGAALVRLRIVVGAVAHAHEPDEHEKGLRREEEEDHNTDLLAVASSGKDSQYLVARAGDTCRETRPRIHPLFVPKSLPDVMPPFPHSLGCLADLVMPRYGQAKPSAMDREVEQKMPGGDGLAPGGASTMIMPAYGRNNEGRRSMFAMEHQRKSLLMFENSVRAKFTTQPVQVNPLVDHFKDDREVARLGTDKAVLNKFRGMCGIGCSAEMVFCCPLLVTVCCGYTALVCHNHHTLAPEAEDAHRLVLRENSLQYIVDPHDENAFMYDTRFGGKEPDCCQAVCYPVMTLCYKPKTDAINEVI